MGWAYEAWDDLLANLRHKDNHTRSIAAQVLCSLAKGDPEGWLLRDFGALHARPQRNGFHQGRRNGRRTLPTEQMENRLLELLA